MRRALLAVAAMTIAVLSAAACTSEPSAIPTVQSPLADSADQVMAGVRFILTAGGVQQGALVADSGFMFENSTRIELRGVRTEFFSKTGEQTGTLTSREGTYLKQRGDLEARDRVVVVSADGARRLTTEQLRYDERTNLITTDSAFVITQEGQVGRGIGFATDPNFTRFECKAACSGVFQVSQPQSQSSQPASQASPPPAELSPPPAELSPPPAELSPPPAQVSSPLPRVSPPPQRMSRSPS